MTNVEKIWHILEIIEDSNGLAPTGKLSQYDARKIDPVVARDDHEQIFEKLEKDEKAIEIVTRPDYIIEYHYRWKLLPGYREVYEKYKKLNQGRSVADDGLGKKEQPKIENQQTALNSKQIRTILESHYEDISQHAKSNWDFFLYVADYVMFVDSTPGLKPVVQMIQQQQEDDFKILKTLESKLKKEVEQAHDKLTTIIQDKEIPTEIVKENLKEYKDYQERRILSSQPLAESLFDCVVDALRALYHKGFGSEIEDFIEEEKSATTPEIRQFIFAPSLQPYHEEREEIEARKKTSLWFAWNELAIAYMSVFNAKKTSDELKEEGRKWEQFNFIGVVGEMREIMGRKDFAQRQPVQFIRPDYEQYVNRVHRFFIEQLISLVADSPHRGSHSRLSPSALRNKRDALLKIKRILDHIQSKREIAPKKQKGFFVRLSDFLGAGQGLIKNEDEVESILKKISEESEAITVTADYATDDIDSWRIYVIGVQKPAEFEKYHEEISGEYETIEPQFQLAKKETSGNGVTPQDVGEGALLDSSFVEAEKRKALSITTLPDHQLLLEKWQKINGILSTVYQQMPPLSPSTRSPIKVDVSTFPKHYVEDVLQFLMRQKVLGYLDYDKDSGVITTKYLRQYLEGQNILVLNREAFENYKISVSTLCSFIEKDWENRFSETPSLRKSVLQVLREPIGVTSKKDDMVAEVVVFSYNPETGDGELRGKATKRLKDGTPERLLFDEAFRNRGHKVTKTDVIRVLSIDADAGNPGVEPTALLSALGDSSKHRKSNKEVQITSKINSAVKEARKKLGLNTNEFVNNGGNVTLTI